MCAWKELVHRDHSAFDKERGILTALLEGVTQSQKATESVPVGTNMSENGGVLRGSKAINNLLGQSLVHPMNLENGWGEVEHRTGHLRVRLGGGKFT